MKKILIILFLILIFNSLPLKAEKVKYVYTIAHSISTSIEARLLRGKMGWIDTDFERADVVLVVCRTYLTMPLDYSYDNIEELDDEADSLLNITGGNLHIYVYAINNDMSLNEIYHDYYWYDD